MAEHAPDERPRLDVESEDADERTVAFTLDGRPAKARPGEVVIAAAERAGTFIPRFCYHPRMKPVGMCRMCLVEVSGPRGATLQPACFVTVAEGMEVTTASDKVKKAQDGVLEFLLVNHPLDCPVCDKGGECPLQDQTLAYGPGESRFVEEKRHFEKPIPISDLVLLDRERCIQCGRCTRFAAEVAGEPQIDFAGRGERVEVATFPDRPFSSYFSANTVQICPVGALTARPYRFTARPWDLDQVESTCTTCAFGCRVAVQASADRLTRLLGIDADPVNQSWLCDKGRFVFESVNGDQVAGAPEQRGRLAEPLVRKDGELVPAGWTEALAAAAEGIRRAKDTHGPGAVALVGGARCTNEGAYAWTKLAKGVIGTDSVDAQLADGLPGEAVLSLARASIDDACGARVVLVLSGDVREELPVLFLRLRAAALEGGTEVVEVAAAETSLTRYAAVSLRARPGDVLTLAEALTPQGAPVAPPAHPHGAIVSAEELARARALLAGEEGDGSGVVVVLGRPSLAENGEVVAAAARRIAVALPAARFLPALRRGNVMGALELGMGPGLLPGRVSLGAGRDWFAAAWGAAPGARGLDTAGILRSLADPQSGAGVRALLVVGADLPRDFVDAALARRALDAADFVVAVCGHPGGVTDWADVVLPAAIEHERPGTTANVEGRVTRLGQKLVPPGQAWPDWMIAAELAAELGADLGFGSTDDVWDEIERLAPAFAGVTREVLSGPAARDGVIVPVRAKGARPRPVEPIDPIATPGVESVERQGAPPRVGLAEPPGAEELPHERRPRLAPLRGGEPVASPAPGAGIEAAAAALGTPHVAPADSYSMRLVSTRRLYDAGSAVVHSPSLAPLAGDATARANPRDLDLLGVQGGDVVAVRSARGSLTLRCEQDARVPRGVVAIDFNLVAPEGGAQNAAAALIDAGEAVVDVRLESLR
ncbi:MAG: NADH-quinone oxidoreductase subunit NuoG [Acidimicrobiales bacterium]